MITTIATNKYILILAVFVAGFATSYFTMTEVEEKTITIVEVKEDTTKVTELEGKIKTLTEQLKQVKIKEHIVIKTNVDGSKEEVINRYSEEQIQTLITLEQDYKVKEEEHIKREQELNQEVSKIQNKRYNTVMLGYSTDNKVSVDYMTTLYKQILVGVEGRSTPKLRDLSVTGSLGFRF